MTTIYVHKGKEVSADAWIGYADAVGNEVQTQPMHMSPQQMTLAGVTTVEQDPMPDEFYGPVVADPNNPGKWIQTPYSEEEMKPRLADYSAQQRLMHETSGQIIEGGGYAMPTSREVRAMVTTGLTTLK